MGVLDAAFLALGRHHSPGAVETGILVLMKGTPPPLPALAEHVRERAECVPALRLRPDRTGPSLRRPRWHHDSARDLGAHVGETRGDGQETLADLAGRTMTRPRPSPDAPPWSLELLHGAAGPGGVDADFALLLRHHHALLDGLGAMAVLRGLLGDGPAVAPPPPPGRTATARPGPARTAAYALRGTASLATDLVRTAPRLPLLRAPAAWPCAVGWTHVPLEVFRDIAKTSRTTVNVVYLAALTLALRDHLAAHGQPVPTAVVATVPMALTPSASPAVAGNSIGPARFRLPTGAEDPGECLRGVHRAARTVSRARRREGSELVLRAGRLLPSPWTRGLLSASMGARSVNLVASNLGLIPDTLACPGGTAAAVAPLVLRPLGGGLSSGVATCGTTVTVSFVTGPRTDPHGTLPERFQRAVSALRRP
ncbi:wax ester/triacylglycerol synthase domain-containing protein [Streptomyces sp. NPDC059570]|uniref:wax ester/triacylglycerol synthase domain-containing protein n=1 Tax=unclassified Streptomyces TaxID=2593676 RepID=UPI0036C32B9E